MKNIPYFIMFCQNSHGVLPRHPVDITQYNRRDFDTFLELDLGEVKYSASDAFTADVINFPDEAGNNSNLRNHGGGSAEGKPNTSTDSSFLKKHPLKKEDVMILKYKNQFGSYEVDVNAAFFLADCGEVLDKDFVIPTGQEDLDKKKCVLAYSLFKHTVKSLEGVPIIRRYEVSMDGRSCWDDLKNKHLSQLTGIYREKYYSNLVHTVVVPNTLKKGVLNYIYEFDGWCIELNKICKPSNVLSDYARRIQMERYLQNVPMIKQVQTQLDLNDQDNIRRGDPVMSEEERMEFYRRQAEVHDEGTKHAMSTQLNAMNTQRQYSNTGHLSANMGELIDEYSFDPLDFDDNDEHQTGFDVNYDVGYDANARYEVHTADAGMGRRYGDAFKDDYMGLDTHEKKAWMSISVKGRESLLNSLENARKQGLQTEPKPPHPAIRRQLQTPIAKGARATNQATTISADDSNGIVVTDTDVTEGQGTATMSLIEAIAHPVQANQTHLLPPGLNPKAYPPADVRRAMSPQNKSPIQRQRIGTMPHHKIPLQNPSKPVSGSGSVTPRQPDGTVHVHFPDILAPQEDATSTRLMNASMICYTDNDILDTHTSDDAVAISAVTCMNGEP